VSKGGQNENRPSRKYLCMMLTNDRTAGRLLDFIVGWHKHAKLHRKGKDGRWSAFSRAALLAGSESTLKQYRRARPLLEGYAHLEGGGHRGKRVLFAQPTIQTISFVTGRYRSIAVARKALAAFGQVAQVTAMPTVSPVSATAPALVPVGAAQGHNEGLHQGHYPIHSFHSPHSTQKKEKPGSDSLSDKTEDDAGFEAAMKQLQATKAKHDAKRYPEVPIPKGCALVHPKRKDPKRWLNLSHKVKTDLYARFLKYLENWKAGKAGKHAASAYGCSSASSYGGFANSMKLKIPKDLVENDPVWAAAQAFKLEFDEDDEAA
jgi:hypothetical protein